MCIVDLCSIQNILGHIKAFYRREGLILQLLLFYLYFDFSSHHSHEWAAVIVDEVHKLKNFKSQITHAMKALKCKVRVGLTGTILQNNLEELWCVMDW